MKEKSELALKLQKLRRERNLKSDDVAKELGIKGATYRRYEIDTHPKGDIYLKLADFYKIPVRFLLSDEISCEEMERQLDAASTDKEDNYNNMGLKDLSRLEAALVKKMRKMDERDLYDTIEFIDKRSAKYEQKN